MPSLPATGEPLVHKLVAPGGASADYFGSAVSASGDLAVIGAPYDDARATNAGAVHVYARTASDWAWQAELLASDGQADDMFGAAVSASGDTIVVGARGDDDRGTSSGSAYVFVRTASGWTEEAKLRAPDGAGGDLFGGAVAVSSGTAVVGAIGDDDRGMNSGSAYVFTREGPAWPLERKLVPVDGAAGDAFGVSVAADGHTAAVGANLDDDRGTSSGAVYVWSRTGTTWSQQAKLVPADGRAADGFGVSVSLAGDALAAGASGGSERGTRSGHAHVYERIAAAWVHGGKLLAPDGARNDELGVSVATDGRRVVAGAHGDGDKGIASGSGWIFERSDAGWTPAVKVLAPEGGAGHAFGASVAFGEGAIVFGAPGDGTLGPAAGSALVRDDNQAPDCSAVAATPSVLWPPDGRMRGVSVAGATDPDGDPVTLTVSGIAQDEAVGAEPDAASMGPGSVLLRAERNGGGDGRVYGLQIVASDGRGGSCTTEVVVVVPKGMGRNQAAADSGVRLASSQPG